MTEFSSSQSPSLHSNLWESQIRAFTATSQMQANQNDEPTSSTSDSACKNKRDQKRRPKPKDGTVLNCQICGDRALGYNFDAITCESCKAFFRRNALKEKAFTCSFEGNCKLDPHTRKFCSGCRLKKCLNVGMKRDWILSDDQLAKRRKKNSHSQSSDDMKELFTGQTQIKGHASSRQFSQSVSHKQDTYCQQGSSSKSEINSVCYLSDSTDVNSSQGSHISLVNTNTVTIKSETIDNKDLPHQLPYNIATPLDELVREYKMIFDSGYSEFEAKRMIEKPNNVNDLFNMTNIFIRRLIKFSKYIPEFKLVQQDDQIHLLKGGIMEIFVLQSAVGFDPANHSWKVRQQQDATEHNIDPSIIKEQLGFSMYQDHMKVVKSLHHLTKSNTTVMILLFMIVIFSPDRPNLNNIEAVTNAQDKYSLWLQRYLESIMPVKEAKTLYQNLQRQLLEVKVLGESGAKLATHLDITKLEPLLIEIFNLQK